MSLSHNSYSTNVSAFFFIKEREIGISYYGLILSTTWLDTLPSAAAVFFLFLSKCVILRSFRTRIGYSIRRFLKQRLSYWNLIGFSSIIYIHLQWNPICCWETKKISCSLHSNLFGGFDRQGSQNRPIPFGKHCVSSHGCVTATRLFLYFGILECWQQWFFFNCPLFLLRLLNIIKTLCAFFNP